MPSVNESAPGTFSFPVRVYYEDTDTAGVVYYAGYLRFLERGRTEWLRALGVGQFRLAQEAGIVFAVRSLNIENNEARGTAGGAQKQNGSVMNVTTDLSIISLVANASIPVMGVMLLLAAVSLMSWYWIFRKWFGIRASCAKTEQF